MFVLPMSKGELSNRLQRIRKRVCCYMRQPCDCKYGASMSGEQTGCPELMVVMELFEAMTDKEYERFCKRIYNTEKKKQKAKTKKPVERIIDDDQWMQE